MRGRKIFGDIVPWNTVWRTGGNFATRFTTSADLVMGGTTILKGAYTLWTLPASTGWKLILNKQTKAPCEGEACTLPTRAPLWGTDYAADSDFVRVRSEEHTSELQSQSNLVCRLLLEKKNKLEVRRGESVRLPVGRDLQIQAPDDI